MMLRPQLFAVVGAAGLTLAGCSIPTQPFGGGAGPTPGLPLVPEGFAAEPVAAEPTPEILPVAYRAEGDKAAGEPLPQPRKTEAIPELGPAEGQRLTLPALVELTLASNPRLAEVGWAIEAARGRAIQAGLYPNPTLSVTGNEIADRTGRSGIWSAYATQEIDTADKLELSRAAALAEVDQATLALVAERYRALTEVRQAFYEAAALNLRSARAAALTSPGWAPPRPNREGLRARRPCSTPG